MPNYIKKMIPSAVILALDLVFMALIPSQVKELTQEGVTTRFMPYVVTVLIAVCAVIDLLGQWIKRDKNAKEKCYFDKKGFARVFLSIAAMFVYLLCMKTVGFVLDTVLLVVVIMLLMGSRNWKQILLVSVVLTLLVYIIFKLGLNLRLPTGLFFF